MNAPNLSLRHSESYESRLASVMTKLPELKAIVADLYPGAVEMEIEEDPEIEGYRYLVFYVESRVSSAEVSARRARWHKLTHELLKGNCDLAFLNVIHLE